MNEKVAKALTFIGGAGIAYLAMRYIGNPLLSLFGLSEWVMLGITLCVMMFSGLMLLGMATIGDTVLLANKKLKR